MREVPCKVKDWVSLTFGEEKERTHGRDRHAQRKETPEQPPTVLAFGEGEFRLALLNRVAMQVEGESGVYGERQERHAGRDGLAGGHELRERNLSG